MKIYYNPKLKQLSRKLRKEGTLAEVLLWQQLKGRKISGYQFTRQKPIGDFIVDFYCSKLHLAIEIDGSSHENKIEYDKKRQEEIEKKRIRVLRFLDNEVKRDLDRIISYIEEWIKNQNLQPPNLNISNEKT